MRKKNCLCLDIFRLNFIFFPFYLDINNINMCFYSIFNLCKRSKKRLISNTSKETLSENKSVLINNKKNYSKIDELLETPLSGEAPKIIIHETDNRIENNKMSSKQNNDCCSSSTSSSDGSSISSSCNSTTSLNIETYNNTKSPLVVNQVSITFDEKTGIVTVGK